MRPLLVAYRPDVPSTRAQSIQVVHAAHAWARRGGEVTLLANPGAPSTDHALVSYGLAPHPNLDLRWLAAAGTVASVQLRWHWDRWVRAHRGRGIVLARSKRYARELLRRYGDAFTLVLEVHEVDSAVAEGEAAEALRTLEAEVLEGAAAVVANAPGTLALLREHHDVEVPAIALHNATHVSRVRRPSGAGEGVGYAGSVRSYKGLDTLARAARVLPWPVTLVGASPDAPSSQALVELSGGQLRLEPPLPHAQLPDRLCAFRTLVLPLSAGVFGERITSPLKLWDYLATGRPVVGADLGALRLAAPGAYLPYEADDVESLVKAVTRVQREEPLRAALLAAASLRTWAQRAEELAGFLEDALPGGLA